VNSFKSLLSLSDLTALYKSTPALTRFFFTETFYGSNVQNVNSDEVEIVSIGATTRPGPGNERGGSARQLQPKGGTKRIATLFNEFNELRLPTDCMHALREPESYGFQEKGRTSLMIQVEEAALKARLHKEIVLRSILVNHRVNVNEDGEILEPTIDATTGAHTDATGTQKSADFGVADSHRGNCGSIVSAQWSTAATKIGEQLDIFQRQNARNGCPRLENVITQSLNKSALRNNTEFNDWAKYNSVRPNAILQGEGIDGLWGMNWHFVDGTWTDKDGTTHDLVPQRCAVLLPSLTNLSWLRAFAGAELVPNSIEIAATPEEALANMELVYGEYAYAQLQISPTRLSLFNGDNFGLGLPDLNCLWRPTVFAALSNLPA